MIRSYLPACNRVVSRIQLFIVLMAMMALSGLSSQLFALQAQTTGPKIWLGERQQLPMQGAGAAAAVTRPAGGRAAVLAGDAGATITPPTPAAAQQPISLAAGDVNEDGFPDLLIGYNGYISIQPGNVDAFAPQSDASFQAIGKGLFPTPFLAQGIKLPTPVNPDFIATGHFTASGHTDLAVAARGGNALFVFPGDGKGNFGAPQQLTLPGGVTAMIAGDLGHAGGFQNVIVGINGTSVPELAIFVGSKDGVNPVAAFPLSASASNFNFGDFGDGNNDLAFLVGGKVQILRAATMKLQTVSLPISATALALGNFILDRAPGLQMALLTADGAVHIAAHSEFDPRAFTAAETQALLQAKRVRTEAHPLVPMRSFPANGWKVVEDIAAGATFPVGQTPVLFRTRISDHQMDDVMVISGSTGQLTVIAHPNAQQGDTTFAAAVVSARPYSGNPLSAIPLRTNIDGRPGVVAIHANESAPSTLMPLPDPTFFVNRIDDPVPGAVASICNNVSNADTSTSCSLREAIIKANATAGTDTIQVPAGTFTLTQPRNAADHHTSLTGTLEVQDSVNIVGAGQNLTIIQGGTDLTTSVDKVISFNQDIDSFTNATVSVSNLTIQNGHNRGDAFTIQDGFGGAFDFDTGGNGTPGTGNATLTMTNVTIQNNAVFDGQGGGFTMFNTLNGTGFATLTNVIVQNNNSTPNASGSLGDGGGGVIDARSKIVMSNVQVLNNTAHANAGTNATGGGLFFQGQHTQPQSHISGSTISGNTAAGIGGGMNNIATLLIDGGTVISNNTAGTNGNHAGGGGIVNDATDGLTLSKVTITGNSTTGNGGGIYTGDGSGLSAVTISFSRIAGNTSTFSAGSNELFNFNATVAGTGNPVSATNDWWGTNLPSSVISQGGSPATSSCPAAVNTNGVCFDPFIVLTHSASPAKIRINQSTTLTGDMSKDNHGNGAALVGNLDRIVGLPITFDGAVLGTIPQAQPETLNASAQATATFNAGGTSGRGTANATVDQGVIGANSNFIASATEVGTTATITTVGVHNFAANETVVIGGVGVGGYNGTFTILATPTPTTFTYTANTSGLGASSGGKANVGIIILAPPSIAKSFSPTVIKVGGTSTITFSITNPNVVTINASFTDDLTSGGTVSGLVVASTPNVVNGCGGSVTANAGATSISFLNAALPVSASPCTITVNVTGTTDGIKPNSVTILSTDAGNGNTATASPSLTVINPPTINKVFGASTIPLNGTTSLTFTITNPNSNAASVLNGISFTDTLPNAAPGTLVIATPNGLTNTCSTTPTATAGSGSISLTGASLPAGASCTISVNVQGTVAGLAPNSVTVSDTVAGTGNTSSTSLIVVAPPTISKAFSPKSIPLNSNSTLSFTLTNPNTGSALSGIAFTDTLPGGVKLASTTVTGSCGSGTISATINNPPGSPSTVSLSGGTLTASPAAGSSCTFSVSVTGITAGTQVNTTSTVSSTEGGTGGTASDTLTVIAPPTISKSFSPKTIPLNGSSTLSFTLTNPNTASALSGVAFTDALPGGVKLASTAVTGSCGSGTITATINNPPGTPSTVSLSGGTLTASPAAGSSCTFSVSVTGISAGAQVNTTSTVSSTEGGTGGTASDTLTVIAPPTISKSFSPKTIPLNGSSTLSFTLTNPNTASALSGVAFTDALPGGVKLASTTVTGSCGSGTITATIGNPPGSPSTVSLSGGTLTASPDPASSCTFSVSVTGISAGTQVNTTGSVSSTEGGTGGTASDTLTVVAPPTISKSFSPNSVPLNGSSTLSFTVTNPNTASALSGVAFTDTLPGGLNLASTTVTGSCGSGTITATINNPPGSPSTVSLSGGTLTASPAAGSSCTFSVSVTGITAGTQVNTTSTVSSTEGGTGGTATSTITVVAPPTISKAFGAAAIAVNGTTTVTFTITNPASNTSAENGIAFSDTLTNGLQVASTPGVTNSCGGTVTAAANSTSISLTGGSIATPGATCTIVVNVTGTLSGTVINTTGAISSTNGGTGATSNTATLIVASPATVTKTFGAAKIPLNGTTSLTINISNPNTNVTLNGLAFTDNLPAGLVIAATPNLSNTCGGTATATAGSSSLSLSGGTLASSASCAVTVNVTGTTAGDKSNSVQVSSTEGGTSATATASLTVVAPPAISKAFGAGSIPLNGTTTVTFTISNPNNPATPANGDLTGVAFSDTLPVSGGPGSATLVVSSTPNVSNTCGGTVTATAGSGVISLSGGSVAHNSTCTLSVDVKGAVEGDANNTTGAISSTEGGTGATSNTATLKVVAPPTISKAFGAANITLNGTTTVTFTITNPASNTSAENGIAFSDTLTNGLQVASTPGVSNTCGGTVTAAANATSISLTGGSIATPGATCTIVVNVTGTQSGTVTNTTGTISSTNGGTGATSNTATLTVASPPSITKTFGAASIPLNGTTTLTFSISNPNTNVTLNGIAFTDNLPAGLVVASTSNLSNTCGGTATATGGSGQVTLSGGTLAASANCTVSVDVTGTTAGVKNNSVQVTSTEGGAGNTSNASVTVTGPPAISKVFGAASIPLNGSTSLSFTINNPNATVALSGVAFSDTLPAGLVVSTPNGLTGSCGTGTITATAGTNVISLSGGTIAANSSCTFSVNVTGTAAGAQTNTTSAVTSTEGGTGGTATASINVEAPPSIAKAFNPTTIALNATTSLTFTITNPAANAQSLTGVAFTDTLPTGLTVANGTSTVCGGTLTTTAPTGIALSGATIAASGQCQFSVTVTGAAAGQYTNTTGAVTSTNGGTGNTASANLTVGTPPTITKAFGAASILLNASTSLTFNISNPNTSLALTGVAFSDTLPAGLVISTPSGLTSNCGGTATATAGSGSISLTGGTLAANGSCTISLNVTGVQAGVQSNTTGPISSNESGAGATSNTATVTVIGPPSISKAFGAATINLNAQTTLSFTITNPNATVALTGVGFGDTLPAGIAVANPNGLTGSCGTGTITTGTVSGFSVVNLSGGTIAAGGSCTFSVNVVGQSGGHKVNTTGTVTSSNAGSGNQATATIDVEAPDPTITKTHSGTFTRGQTGAQWTITVSNVGFGPTVGTVTMTDTLPNVQNPPVATAISGTGWTCTLATLTCTRADALASGSSYPPITLTVNIPTNIVNNFTNTATVSGGGDVNPNNNTATDKISLGPPVVITPHAASTATVVPGTAGQFVFDVEDDDPSLGTLTFGCSGLPVGATCSFNPPATTQAISQVTMTITTSNHSSNAVTGQNFDGKPPRFLAALFLPVLGFVGICLGGRSNKKLRVRLALAVVGMVTLMTFAGCGGVHGITTPAGNYQITVTAATATVQATTQVTLTVQ